jgi:hypothetical protein
VKRLRVPWTANENERLKAFVAKDVSVVRVAAVFKRRLSACAIKLAISVPHFHQ